MRWIFNLFRAKKRSPIKVEIENLCKKISETDQYLSDIEAEFWRRGGICCPGCGVPGFLDLQEKQNRRRKRLQGLRDGIAGPVTDEFAQADGFGSVEDMWLFWRKEHPDTPDFRGVLIRWEPLQVQR